MMAIVIILIALSVLGVLIAIQLAHMYKANCKRNSNMYQRISLATTRFAFWSYNWALTSPIKASAARPTSERTFWDI